MTKSEYIQLVIDIAEKEVGYLEKRSNANLDSKTGNAGSANYTKYGRDMHKLYPSVMDFPAAWCDCFVDWCFYKAYGITNAKALIRGNFNDYTVASAQLYKNKGAWYKSPKVGDQIFFKNSSRICHTGLVVKVTSTKVYTIEGNTSGASGVVANGGGVKAKSYYLSSSYIAGYGRPAYEKFCAKEVVNEKQTTSSTDTKLNKTSKWEGVVYNTTSLNVRKGAGTSYDKCSFSPLKKKTKVSVCDSLKDSKGAVWYYIKYNGKYGFVHSSYIKKVVKYTTTSNLNLRKEAGVIEAENVLCVVPKGKKVVYENKYKTVNGVKWYYVTYDGKTGYASGKYLKK